MTRKARHKLEVGAIEAAIRREAARAPFPVDEAVYERAGKDPGEPVLYAGSLDAPICAFARDLGKDEVAHGQPLVGAAGRLVRSEVYETWEGEPPQKSDRLIAKALDHILLTNTVPYKPPGNKAYAASVKERFRPFIAAFLAGCWQGDRVITLGTEAFQWFAPYQTEPGAAEALWDLGDDRYEADLPCLLTAEFDGETFEKPITVSPLPHPSPLNQRWYAKFPGLLAKRLKAIRAES